MQGHTHRDPHSYRESAAASSVDSSADPSGYDQRTVARTLQFYGMTNAQIQGHTHCDRH